MAELLEIQKELKIKRTRKRLESLNIDKEEISNRIHDFYTDDHLAKDTDRESRLQRYAKYRGWTEGRDWIGDVTSDIALPDMMIHALRIQDTLHNAVMSQRPAIISTAVKKEDTDKQEMVDNLIDYQVFVEQNGEKMLEKVAEDFVNDGVYTLFIPWIKEDKKVSEVRIDDPIPEDLVPAAYFEEILEREFKEEAFSQSKDGWDWKSDDKKVSFYTREDARVEIVIERSVRVFDGPKVIVKEYEDVLTPARAANLQAPGPSNPGGATHVILLDYPTIDEIKSLKKSGFYDLITQEELDELEKVTMDESYQAEKKQKEEFKGKTSDKPDKEDSHRPLTRIVCFDLYDIDKDGLNEDVMWWMILETKTMLKAKHLTEMYPANPPRRPLSQAEFLPGGISLLEMIEGMHDLDKQILDQMMDAGTLGMTPFFFYRPSSNIKQEVMRLYAGEGYPVSDPHNDINFPQINNQSQAFGINMHTLTTQFTEKLTMEGDLQFGRIPAGKSSALRTSQNMQQVLGQAEARPERILRRFFQGFTEAWAQIHELNKFFLPEKKKFRIIGYTKDDPYLEITDKKEIEGRFQFTFSANILNTSKSALQEGLTQLMSAYLNPLPIQMGLVTPENTYRLLKDWGKAWGQDPENKYLTPPTEGADKPKILAEEAISTIMDGQVPAGEPEEGAMAHLQKLQAFIQEEQQREEPFLSETEKQIFEQYFSRIAQRAQEELKQQQLQAAAANFNPGQPGGGGQDIGGNQIVQENELLAEDLPTSGGGGAV